MQATALAFPPPETTFFLAGATAVGKTDLAVAVAKELGAEIVGCDAFQIYEGLDLLTAKPSKDALSSVPHHLISAIPLSQCFDVAQYRAMALQGISEIHRRGKKVLVVGGTGFYLRALTRGLPQVPSASPELRAELASQPLLYLQEKLQELDPQSFSRIDLSNPRRVIRALEVCILSGRPFSSFHEEANSSAADYSGVLLDRDRSELYERINQRVEVMYACDVLDEVAAAGPISETASQCLGLREVQAVLQQELTASQAVEAIQLNSRRYAKRQGTWFKKEGWLRPLNLSRLPSLDAQLQVVMDLLGQTRTN